MPMFNPAHPGALLREDVLPALKSEHRIGINELARRLGYSRPHFSTVVHEKSPITADLALRLERAGIGSARHWLAMQSAYDLWQAEQREQPEITRIH
ncbi:HigA family addiction module antitoxin [Pseudomonas aeruginosa]|uniref:HigA family addiction module antitoxin n=1 Tax=Pseudomonas aeruginosa TaxID=287 RepID=UPI00376EA633|nr:HigA family addiction module antidote protein [Pseudomonas aeruginosa]